MADAVALKTCPFCGGDPVEKSDVRHGKDEKTAIRFYWVKCADEDCRVSTMADTTRESAVELWNRRA